MQKTKHFKVSVIMHTMSKATYDQNIFYTSDSELMLKFELIEKEFSYDSGEILLFNENDKSFVTRGISKDDDGFVYQIESDIIQHHGEWTGQLQLVKNGEVYTSKPFQFTIENDLSSVSPPQLIDINNWATLKQSAIDLIDDMQTVIEGYDQAAIEFQQDENVRIDNEKDRIQAESTRQNHETTRQNQERVRESNEAVRKANEAARQVNETTRQANESSRQQAEQGRVSAESSRVSAEEQRKIDHENRSDELAGKADKVVINNFIENGDVESSYTFETSSYINFLKTGGMVGPLNYSNAQSIIPAVSGHEYYVRAVFSQGTVRERLYFIYEDNSVSFNDGVLVETDMVSGIITAIKTANANLRMYGSAGEKTKKSVMMIDLTATFGAGSEPTKEEMDKFIDFTGYIDGEYALNNKEMLIWTLALIRRNKNAIITLGGTI